MRADDGEDRPASAGETERCAFDVGRYAVAPARAMLHVAAVGGDAALVLEGFRACPGREVLLLHARRDASRARKLARTFANARVPARLREVRGSDLAHFLREASAVLDEARVGFAGAYLNASSGSRDAGCALLTAAYLHGALAFFLDGDKARLVPVPPIDHQGRIGPVAEDLLRALATAPRGERSLGSLVREGRDRDEIAHEVLDEPGRRGLASLGLVAQRRRFGRRGLRITPTGRAILGGVHRFHFPFNPQGNGPSHRRAASGARRSMGILQIATVGDETDAIMIGVREYPVSRLILIHTPEHKKQAEEVRRGLSLLKLQTDLVQIEGDIMLGVLRVVGSAVNDHLQDHDDVYVNVASGTRMTGCAATAAAFVNGVKAFGVMDGKPFFLPVLKFSYHELVSDAKIEILRAIESHGDKLESLQSLSDATGLDKSLLSYHIRGGRESKGLEDLGLVEIDRGARGRLGIKLTPMGLMFVAGQPRARERSPGA